jgi:hypothetical protein
MVWGKNRRCIPKWCARRSTPSSPSRTGSTSATYTIPLQTRGNHCRHDYVESANLGSAASVIEQTQAWFDDYNEVAPHSALGMKSPREHRAEQTLSASP